MWSTQPCAGTQAPLPQNCQCADPGVVNAGLNVIVNDAYLCPRRLQPMRDGSGNVINGVLAVVGNGMTASVIWTNQPQVAYPQMAPLQSQSFGQIVIASGSTGAAFRLQPPAVPNLVLQTDGLGALEFGPIPPATVPDPLTVGTLTVNTLATVNQLVVQGITGAIAAGTIVSFLGLNATNQFVTGGIALLTMDFFYEQPSRTSTLFPNNALVNGGACTIGNHIGTPSGNVNVTNGTTLTIVNAGTYRIDWMGAFARPAAGTGTVGLSLSVGGNITNPGERGLQQSASNYATALVCGSDVEVINANTTIQIIVTGLDSAPRTSGYNLQDVQVIITKFK